MRIGFSQFLSRLLLAKVIVTFFLIFLRTVKLYEEQTDTAFEFLHLSLFSFVTNYSIFCDVVVMPISL